MENGSMEVQQNGSGTLSPETKLTCVETDELSFGMEVCTYDNMGMRPEEDEEILTTSSLVHFRDTDGTTGDGEGSQDEGSDRDKVALESKDNDGSDIQQKSSSDSNCLLILDRPQLYEPYSMDDSSALDDGSQTSQTDDTFHVDTSSQNRDLDSQDYLSSEVGTITTSEGEEVKSAWEEGEGEKREGGEGGSRSGGISGGLVSHGRTLREEEGGRGRGGRCYLHARFRQDKSVLQGHGGSGDWSRRSGCRSGGSESPKLGSRQGLMQCTGESSDSSETTAEEEFSVRTTRRCKRPVSQPHLSSQTPSPSSKKQKSLHEPPRNILGAILTDIPEIDIRPMALSNFPKRSKYSSPANYVASNYSTNHKEPSPSPTSSHSLPQKHISGPSSGKRDKIDEVSRSETKSSLNGIQLESGPQGEERGEEGGRGGREEVTGDGAGKCSGADAQEEEGEGVGKRRDVGRRRRKKENKKMENTASAHYRILMSWERDYPLGLRATRAPILYALEKIPDKLKAVKGGWINKAKLIWATWRRRSVAQRDEYCEKAKLNRLREKEFRDHSLSNRASRKAKHSEKRPNLTTGVAPTPHTPQTNHQTKAPSNESKDKNKEPSSSNHSRNKPGTPKAADRGKAVPEAWLQGGRKSGEKDGHSNGRFANEASSNQSQFVSFEKTAAVDMKESNSAKAHPHAPGVTTHPSVSAGLPFALSSIPYPSLPSPVGMYFPILASPAHPSSPNFNIASVPVALTSPLSPFIQFGFFPSDHPLGPTSVVKSHTSFTPSKSHDPSPTAKKNSTQKKPTQRRNSISVLPCSQTGSKKEIQSKEKETSVNKSDLSPKVTASSGRESVELLSHSDTTASRRKGASCSDKLGSPASVSMSNGPLIVQLPVQSLPSSLSHPPQCSSPHLTPPTLSDSPALPPTMLLPLPVTTSHSESTRTSLPLDHVTSPLTRPHVLTTCDPSRAHPINLTPSSRNHKRTPTPHSRSSGSTGTEPTNHTIHSSLRQSLSAGLTPLSPSSSSNSSLPTTQATLLTAISGVLSSTRPPFSFSSPSTITSNNPRTSLPTLPSDHQASFGLPFSTTLSPANHTGPTPQFHSSTIACLPSIGSTVSHFPTSKCTPTSEVGSRRTCRIAAPATSAVPHYQAMYTLANGSAVNPISTNSGTHAIVPACGSFITPCTSISDEQTRLTQKHLENLTELRSFLTTSDHEQFTVDEPHQLSLLSQGSNEGISIYKQKNIAISNYTCAVAGRDMNWMTATQNKCVGSGVSTSKAATMDVNTVLAVSTAVSQSVSSAIECMTICSTSSQSDAGNGLSYRLKRLVSGGSFGESESPPTSTKSISARPQSLDTVKIDGSSLEKVAQKKKRQSNSSSPSKTCFKRPLQLETFRLPASFSAQKEDILGPGSVIPLGLDALIPQLPTDLSLSGCNTESTGGSSVGKRCLSNASPTSTPVCGGFMDFSVMTPQVYSVAPPLASQTYSVAPPSSSQTHSVAPPSASTQLHSQYPMAISADNSFQRKGGPKDHEKQITSTSAMREVEGAPSTAAMREVGGTPSTAAMREVGGTPSTAAMREVEGTSSTAAMREVGGAPSTAAMREVGGTPSTSAMREVGGAPSTAAMREVGGTPSTSAMREVEGAPSTAAMREVGGTPSTAAMREGGGALEQRPTFTQPLPSVLPLQAPLTVQAVTAMDQVWLGSCVREPAVTNSRSAVTNSSLDTKTTSLPDKTRCPADKKRSPPDKTVKGKVVGGRGKRMQSGNKKQVAEVSRSLSSQSRNNQLSSGSVAHSILPHPLTILPLSPTSPHTAVPHTPIPHASMSHTAIPDTPIPTPNTPPMPFGTGKMKPGQPVLSPGQPNTPFAQPAMISGQLAPILPQHGLTFNKNLACWELERLYYHNVTLLEQQRRYTKFLENELRRMEFSCREADPGNRISSEQLHNYRQFLNYVVEPEFETNVPLPFPECHKNPESSFMFKGIFDNPTLPPELDYYAEFLKRCNANKPPLPMTTTT